MATLKAVIIDEKQDGTAMVRVRFFNKPITSNRLEMFKTYTKRAISGKINDIVNSRLKSALSISEEKEEEQQEEILIEDNDGIITTEEELEGFQIVKAILREKLSADRISYRDTKSYFGILLDDNNRKPICRLHFNSSNKYLELFNEGKDSSKKIQIESLDDIYNYKKELLTTIDNYYEYKN